MFHQAARCPEQAYLSQLFAGEFTHIAQQFNSEVNPHGGVPLTEVWRTQVVASLENLGCLRGD